MNQRSGELRNGAASSYHTSPVILDLPVEIARCGLIGHQHRARDRIGHIVLSSRSVVELTAAAVQVMPFGAS
jgi:hypothetical protein